MFGLALSLWIIDLHMVIVEVQNTLLSASIGPLEDLYPLALSKVQAMAAVEDVLYAYMVSPPIYMIAESYPTNLSILQTIIGDSIIIWRVHAFWSRGSLRQRLVILLPIALLLGSIGA